MIIKKGIAYFLSTVIMMSIFTSCKNDEGISLESDSENVNQTDFFETEIEQTTSTTEITEENLSIKKKNLYEEFKGSAVSGDNENENYGKRYQIENGKLDGLQVMQDIDGYTGKGAVGKFDDNKQNATIYINIEKEGFYDLTVMTASPYGDKTNFLTINDDSTCEINTKNGKEFVPVQFSNIYLNKGINKFYFHSSWGWILIDCMYIKQSPPFDESIFNVSPVLVNPNADNNTKRLMKFLTDNYGKKIITGQHVDYGMDSMEIKAIKNLTGEYPALAEFDLMDYSPTRVKFGAKGVSVDYAIEWGTTHNGIVAFSWHWNAPKDLPNVKGREWWSGFYTKATDFDLEKALSKEDKEGYDLLISDMDAIAKELKRLQDAGVPVLWRPLHEASGGWFWWGAKGPEAYKKLWKLMYDRFTNYHKLNNIIWIYNAQSKDWYPGDEYVDIIGEDIYANNHDYSSQSARFNQAGNCTESKKIIAMTENGVVPDIDLLMRDRAAWSWYATWVGDFVLVNSKLDKYSDKYTEEYILKKMYASEHSITLSRLPDLKKYPLD